LWLCLGSNEEITRARYRSGKGFLLHLAQTYDFMQPHLKGLHLAEDAWRPNRGLDGWKQSGADQWEDDVDYEDDEWSEEKLGFGKEEDLEAPDTVAKLPRLREDVVALRGFFEPESPVQ
jgi:hypothetical protein